MSKLTRTSVLTAVFAVLLGGSFACNTIGGIGKDVKNLGGSVEKAADSNKASSTKPSK